jgi:hypothetical protein
VNLAGRANTTETAETTERAGLFFVLALASAFAMDRQRKEKVVLPCISAVSVVESR